MTFVSSGCWKWTAGLVLLSSILARHVIEGASYGESCVQASDCAGKGMNCSSVNLCTCIQGYKHYAGDKECEALQYQDEVFVLDFTISNNSTFKTDMTSDDLDFSRCQEIKNQLKLQLTELFENITGFKSVEVTAIGIVPNNNLLVANWTVRLNRLDPKFVNATPEQIGDIIGPELKAASRQYKDIVRIDTRRRASSTRKDSRDNLALGLGLGLGLPGIAIICGVVAVTVVLYKRKSAAKTAKSISDQESVSSSTTGRSSKLDPENYHYNVFMKDGYSIPPHYVKLAAPSDAGSSSTFFATVNDKTTLHKST